MYKGKKQCAGCGKSGEEKPRPSVDSLCFTCRSELNFGRDKAKDITEYGVLDIDWYYPKTYMLNKNDVGNNHYSDDKTVDIPYTGSFDNHFYKRLHDFLKTINLGSQKNITVKVFSEKNNQTDRYFVSKETALAFFEMMKELHEYVAIIKRDSFRKGNDLLKGLNNGTLTLNDFEEKVSQNNG